MYEIFSSFVAWSAVFFGLLASYIFLRNSRRRQALMDRMKVVIRLAICIECLLIALVYSVVALGLTDQLPQFGMTYLRPILVALLGSLAAYGYIES